MNKKTITILIILALLFVGVFEYVSKSEYEYNFSPPPLAPEDISNIITPEIQELTFPDNTLDVSAWQTYSNEEYGFEISYPNGWKVKIKKQAFKNVWPIQLQLFFTRRAYSDQVLDNSKIEGSVAMLTIYKGDLIESILKHGGDKEILNINNITIYQLSKNPPSSPYINWYFEKKSSVYNFVETDATHNEDISILEKIILSFKFTK